MCEMIRFVTLYTVYRASLHISSRAMVKVSVFHRSMGVYLTLSATR